jgi:hypothetical protein
VGDPTIRKQVYELVPEDFAVAHVWEFALDEEDVAGQDEATVRPRRELESADPDEGMFAVEAEFVSADGTRFTGYATPQREDNMGWIQPTIVTAGGQVNFWLGAFPPESLEMAYGTVGKTPSELFPLRYRSVVPTEGVPLEGELHGFMSQSLDSDEIVTRT